MTWILWKGWFRWIKQIQRLCSNVILIILWKSFLNGIWQSLNFSCQDKNKTVPPITELTINLMYVFDSPTVSKRARKSYNQQKENISIWSYCINKKFGLFACVFSYLFLYNSSVLRIACPEKVCQLTCRNSVWVFFQNRPPFYC